MNITILGRQSDMTISDQQRTKRCLRVLKDVGFDIQLRFSKQSPELFYTVPAQSLNIPYTYKHLLQLSEAGTVN
jgi:hypothetical protein